MAQPRVSVVIPAYNAGRYLRECLQSIKQQTYKDFEIIVVDDCSTDDTFKIAQEEGAIVARNDKNLGQGPTRNTGIKLAKGEIIANTDSDVIVPPKWLENILADMARFNVDCVGGGYIGLAGNTFVEGFSFFELLFRRKNFHGFVKTLVGNNFACSKKILEEIGGFPTHFKYTCDDLYLSYKISKKHLIYWDQDNGVYHHFRNKVYNYLRQQYFFAKDTVLTYYWYPELFFLKTHQGRQLYLETILVYLFYALLFLKPVIAVLPLALIMLMNVEFLVFLAKNKISWLKSLGLVLLRDFVCSFGVISGIIHVFLALLKIKS